MRCKYCGSQLIYPETQHKTFSTGKAVAGAVTFGVVGAAAGFIGKDQKGYKCGACGAFMETTMDFMTESSINRAVKEAERGENRSLYDYFKGQYPNIQADIPATSIAGSSAPVIIPSNQLMSDVDSENASEKDPSRIVKHRYKYAKWEPDAPVYIESIVIETSDSDDLLWAVITNQSAKTIRSAYFEVSVFDDTGDLINEQECVYQGLNIGSEDKFPFDKYFKLGTEVAYQVSMICQKVSFTDNSVWRRTSELQSFMLNEQPKMTDETFPRLKYVRDMLQDYSALDKEAELFLPYEADGFWQCICGHPVRKDALCPKCHASYVKLQELLSQENLVDIQQKAVKARAAARAEKTISLYEDAVKLCKAEEEKAAAEKKAAEEKRIAAEKERIAAEKREAEEQEKRRIQLAEEQALKEAKQKRYRKIGGICAGIVVVLAVGITWYNQYTTEKNYTTAVALMKQGEYEQAIDKFKLVSDYKDASSLIKDTETLIKECTDKENLNAAKSAEENGDVDEAEAYYEQLDSEIVNASKYEYISSHKDSADAITEKYINDLYDEYYERENIIELMNEIYPVTVNMALNRSEDDDFTNLESTVIKEYDEMVFFHMTVEGGLAGHEYSLKLIGNTDMKTGFNSVVYQGSLPANLISFYEKEFDIKSNYIYIHGLSQCEYVEMELLDQESGEVLKTVKMELKHN